MAVLILPLQTMILAVIYCIVSFGFFRYLMWIDGELVKFHNLTGGRWAIRILNAVVSALWPITIWFTVPDWNWPACKRFLARLDDGPLWFFAGALAWCLYTVSYVLRDAWHHFSTIP